MAARSIVRCAVTAPPKAAPKSLKALNITKGSLQSWGNKTTKNIDGMLLDITYEPATDVITVVDRTQQIEYPAVVGAKDNRISIDLEAPIYLTNAPNFQQLQAVLRGDAAGPEFLNGRVAMVAFLACTAVELATQRSVVEQALTPEGALGAVVLVSLTALASLAPALAGKQRVERVFPSLTDPYSDRQLPYYFHPLAEIINGRAAMVGLLGLVGYELVKKAPFF